MRRGSHSQAAGLDARAYVLIDYQSGRVLAADKADVQMEPASITKLMTGYVVFRGAAREAPAARRRTCTISEHAWKRRIGSAVTIRASGHADARSKCSSRA